MPTGENCAHKSIFLVKDNRGEDAALQLKSSSLSNHERPRTHRRRTETCFGHWKTSSCPRSTGRASGAALSRHACGQSDGNLGNTAAGLTVTWATGSLVDTQWGKLDMFNLRFFRTTRMGRQRKHQQPDFSMTLSLPVAPFRVTLR